MISPDPSAQAPHYGGCCPDGKRAWVALHKTITRLTTFLTVSKGKKPFPAKKFIRIHGEMFKALKALMPHTSPSERRGLAALVKRCLEQMSGKKYVIRKGKLVEVVKKKAAEDAR